MAIQIGCSAPPFSGQKGRKLLIPVPITLGGASGFASGFVRVTLMNTSSPLGVLTIQEIPNLWTAAAPPPGAIASVISPVFSTSGTLPHFTAFPAFLDTVGMTTPTTGYGANYQIDVLDTSNVLQGSMPFTLTGNASPAQSVDVIFAVDRGFTMGRTDPSGKTRLDRLKSAFLRGVRLLRDDDKLGFVSFANLMNATNPQLASDFATSAQQDEAIRRVNDLVVDDVTPLSKPIQQGLNFARQMSQTATVVLITDGSNNNSTGLVLAQPTLPTSAMIIGEVADRVPATAPLLASSGGHFVYAIPQTLGDFAIEKLLTQVLIGLGGSVFITDPDGSLKAGETQIFPIDITEADREITAIAYSNHADALQVTVELLNKREPSEYENKPPRDEQRDKGVVIDRVKLEPPKGPDIVVTPRVIVHRPKTASARDEDQVRFNLLVTAKTDLNLDAQVAASGLSVGSDLLFSAVLSQYGRAWPDEAASVKVELTHPDGHVQTLDLHHVHGAPERFEGSIRTFRPGAYHAHFIATGRSLLQHRRFRRECVRTIAVYPPHECCPPDVGCAPGYPRT